MGEFSIQIVGNDSVNCFSEKCKQTSPLIILRFSTQFIILHLSLYEPEFKKKMVRLVLEEGRTIASVNKEYNLGEGTVRSWIRQFEEECEKNPEIKETKDIYEENRRLRKKLEEAEKEVRFLKKAAAFFAKEID